MTKPNTKGAVIDNPIRYKARSQSPEIKRSMPPIIPEKPETNLKITKVVLIKLRIIFILKS